MSIGSVGNLQIGDVLPVPQAARELGVHFTTLYRWIEKGSVSFFKFGGTVFIPVTEVYRLKREMKKADPKRGEKEEAASG